MDKKNLIYFDHAATTHTESRVWRAMKPYFDRHFGNAGSLHEFGRDSQAGLAWARQRTACFLGAEPKEIVFTGSGTESDNLAVLGTVRSHADVGRHLISTNIEHKAVLNPMKKLAEEGFQVDLLAVDRQGLVSVDDLAEKIGDQTVLISIIYASNEIGVIEPVSRIGQLVSEVRRSRKERGVRTPLVFHTDACQAAGYLPMKVDELGVDLLTLNGSKVYGPKGIGVLYVRKGVKLDPLMFGGDQENGLRPGTENVPGAVGLGEALRMVEEFRDKEAVRQTELRDLFIERLTGEIPGVVLNGHPTERMPNNINVSVLGVEGEAMVLWLDKHGIAASTGSACDSRHLEPSHVIMALGGGFEHAHGSLRLTLGRKTTRKEIDRFMEVFPGIVDKLRKMSAVEHG